MSDEDPVEWLAKLDEGRQRLALAGLTPPQRRELNERWARWAHDGQAPPEGEWHVWLMMAGRGFGKTRAGAEWVSALARVNGGLNIALVSATMEDARKVMIEGESGLLAVAQTGERPRWEPTAGTITFNSGARAFLYSAGSPEKLRGPEHHHAWCDELAKWRNSGGWDNLMLGLRLGERPRVLVTTTPKPVALLRRIAAMPGVVVTRGASGDNVNLPETFLETMKALYGSTRLGRQELDGELIEDVEGALWSRALIEACRVRDMPEVARVVIGVDPPAGTEGDACGIVAVGLGKDGRGFVIEDATVSGATPERWARGVAACAARYGADRVVAEANNGGAMVKSVLLAADVSLPVKLVHASRGKSARAEPVAALYESGRVAHVGGFPALEDEMCGMLAGGGYEGPGRSPDRADALVWALTELMLGRRGEARVRGL